MNWEKLDKQIEKLDLEEQRIRNQKKLLKAKEKKFKISRYIKLGEELEKRGWNVKEDDFEFVTNILCEELSKRLATVQNKP